LIGVRRFVHLSLGARLEAAKSLEGQVSQYLDIRDEAAGDLEARDDPYGHS
jgi:hypothetical protein